MKQMKAIVDPADNIQYKSFYIFALRSILGQHNVYFDAKPFRALSNKARSTASIRFILSSGSEDTKYVISGRDSYMIDEELYEWCDVYGGVNTNYAKTPEKYYPKMVALCPSFGINCFSPAGVILRATVDCLKAPKERVRTFLGHYYRMYRDRLPYASYLDYKPAGNNYVFFCSTLWYSDEWNHNDEKVNKTRANFIRACKSVEGLQFEGGFVSQGANRSSEELFSDCLGHKYSMKEWLTNTKKSVCVFNTPAFWDCHGWKLGEYLALGKAIISTQLSNDLPAPLEHGKNIHFVENSQEAMKEAIIYITSHPEYRQKLERGAKEYWDTYGSPEKSLELLGINA